MSVFDRIFLFCIVAPLFPILFFLTGWWISLICIDNSLVFLPALAGLLIGILLDCKYLSFWVNRAYHMRKGVLLSIYVFYSVGIFGFCMGVPVFNIFLGVPTGIFIVRQSLFQKLPVEEIRQRIIKASWISVCFLIPVCFASAAIALTDPYTAENLMGMFRLPFMVTRGMIIGLILCGGSILIALQYGITTASARITLLKSHHS